MFSVSPEIYSVLSVASRWLFAFFALVILFFAFAWHRSDRKERRERFRNLPGAGTVGEFLVLSGGDELQPNTWFPVPREGVLGSLRSCDLVVPCPGVRSQHLDFSWQDGTGLLVRPRIGCEVLVDGVPVSRRGAYADSPLRHGSLLQIGSAVLRLQLFSALSDTNRVFNQQIPVAGTETGFAAPPQAPAAPYPPSPYCPAFPRPEQSPVQIPQPPVQQVQPPVPEQLPLPDQSAQPQPTQQAPAAPRRRRSDRWKEDWSD